MVNNDCVTTVALSGETLIKEETFEGFEDGAWVTSSDDWRKWPGGENARVVSGDAYEGQKALEISLASDMLMNIPTEAGKVYVVTWMMKITGSGTASYNFQATTTEGEMWTISVEIKGSNIYTHVGSNGYLQLQLHSSNHLHDDWFEVKHVFDLRASGSETVTVIIGAESQTYSLAGIAIGGSFVQMINFIALDGWGTLDGEPIAFTATPYLVDNIRHAEQVVAPEHVQSSSS